MLSNQNWELLQKVGTAGRSDSTMGEKVSVETQTEACVLPQQERGGKSAEQIREIVNRKPGYEEVLSLIAEKWPKDAYQKTEIGKKVANFEEMTDDMAILCKMDEEGEKLISQAEKTCKVTRELRKRGLKAGQLSYGARCNRIVLDREEEIKDDNKYTYILPVDAVGEGEWKNLDTFNMVKKWAEEMKIKNRGKVSLVTQAGINKSEIRKLVEGVLAENAVTVTIVSISGIVRETGKQEELGDPKKPGKRNGGLVIKTGDRRYADVLTEMRSKIDIGKIGVEIKNTRKTAKGDILVTVKGGLEKVKVLTKEVEEKMKETKIVKKDERMTVFIYNIDPAVTQDEFRGEIAEQLSIPIQSTEEIEINLLRSNGNKTAVLVLPRSLGNKLCRIGKIKVGWTSCAVRPKILVSRCFRCREQGHLATKCEGPDRREECWRCGKMGHRMKDCSGEPYCIDCKQEGHVAESSSCDVMRKRIKETDKGRRTLEGSNNDP